MQFHPGIANICLLTQHTTIVRQRIDVPVPRKRKGGGTALGADKVRRSGPLVPLVVSC
jgi:stalled ribosome rescue protein Dom34